MGNLVHRLAWRWRHRQRTELWRRLAEGAGLTVIDASPTGVVAEIGQLSVTVEALAQRDLERGRVPGDATITFRWHTLADVSIVARKVGAAAPEILSPALGLVIAGAPGEPFGGEAFERTFDIFGPPAIRKRSAILRALLDADTRRCLENLLAVLRGDIPTLDATCVQHLVTAHVPALARTGLAARLAENARREPVAGVRVATLRCLARDFPDDPETQHAAQAFFTDPDAWVRFEATKVLPAESRPVLVDLAQRAAAEECALQALHAIRGTLTRDEIRSGLVASMKLRHWDVAAQWVAVLGTELDADDTRAVVRSLALWRQGAPTSEFLDTAPGVEPRAPRAPRYTILGALFSSDEEDRFVERLQEFERRRDELLARHGVPLIVALVRRLRRAPEGEGRDEALVEALSGPWDVRVAAAQALVRDPKHLRRLWNHPELIPALGGLEAADFPMAEAALLALLAHPSVDVARAAVVQLGRSSDRSVITALHDHAEKHAWDRGTASAARQAIAEIQSRLPGASPGQLSMAGAEAGQVTLVSEDERGRVTVAKGVSDPVSGPGAVKST